jgi:hypothetical protein
MPKGFLSSKVLAKSPTMMYDANPFEKPPVNISVRSWCFSDTFADMAQIADFTMLALLPNSLAKLSLL